MLSKPAMAHRYDFASDNTAGAMPEVWTALSAADAGPASGYGADQTSARAADLVRGAFDADAEVRFLASGTAANALALACLARPHEAIAAHAHAHVTTDETGAPAFYGSGVGLIPLAGPSARIEPAALAEALAQPDSPHRQPLACLSLTNATEYGAVYSDAALAELTGMAKAHGHGVHLDGARLANAVAAGCDLTAIPKMGVDIVVMGGTKAGSTPSEALVIFDRAIARRIDSRLKHAGQLVSKGRYLAAPWVGMLETGAWASRAGHANAMARALAALSPFALAHPVEANAVFVTMDEPALARLHAAGWMAYRVLDGSVRFMCSWSTTPADVEALGAALKAIQ